MALSEPPPAWHPEVLPERWVVAAEDLARRSVLSGFYLAGGTGLALQFGHRRSLDLDLFQQAEFESTVLRDRLRDQDGLRGLELAPGTAHLILHGVKVSFLHYPYPLIFPVRAYGNIEVADQRDIACMKVEAIASRGSRRDFVDLCVAARAYGLREIFAIFAKKYAAVSYSRTHLLKALTFRDAEAEPEPDMLMPIEWRTVTDYFTSEAPRLALRS